jgi:hypothetical protein
MQKSWQTIDRSTVFWSENLQERDNLDDVEADKRIILK